VTVLRTLIGMADALAGALRYKIGLSLLRLFIVMNRKKPAPELFRSGWKFIWATRWFFKGKEAYGNRYRINWRNFAYMRLLEQVKARDLSFVPELERVNHRALTALAASGRPIVMVAIHARLISCLNKMLEDLGIASSVVAISDETNRVSKLFGLKGEVDIIPLDADSMLLARQRLKMGRLVCCCADFTVRRPGTLYHDRYIADGMFAFAQKCHASLIYAVAGITDAGEARIVVAEPAVSENGCSSVELAADFIRFIESATDSPPGWKIGSWALRSASTRKQHDNLWIRPPAETASARQAPAKSGRARAA
jgi:hypothetical protein